ncbi:H(+)-transporting V1 sector ATPase subunit E PWA37_002360 [Arxiozyma heterogenica]|uniref:H(+)-transporting V1 sector ATPase subunit E n=1 Tax=Arxiozyma heterogenica TaxID=278026 RepID=UPI002F000D6F
MSSSIITSLTPNQVNDELNKMQAFIKKEAEEKAREIKLKANQEYEIEKTNLVRQEISNIDSNYEKNLKKIYLEKQIMKSTIDNQIRLKVLNKRNDSLNEIFEETQKQLRDKITNDETLYKDILHKLILESVLRLLESQVVIQVKESDLPIVENEEFLNKITEEYKTTTNGKNLKIAVSKDYLSPELIGGVIVKDSSEKIKLNNTIDERLKLLHEEALPAIRLEMFGITKTRKFFD